LSLAWSFAALPREVGSLSLAMGVCALRALQRSGVQGVALKWPNDLVVGAAKLGGILVELRAEAGGPALVIIGVGLNVALGPLLSQRVRSTGTHPADLVGVSGGPVDRHRLAAQLMAACIEGLEQFEQQGLRPFLAAWREADALAGCRVVVQADQERVHGHARGIDATGALCVQTREGVQRFMTGDVTVRAST
jgi:BirA family biotin operon repressor/biotin-[acetyl-CoA-carboxylase] ligase